jgi:hypothetical protein
LNIKHLRQRENLQFLSLSEANCSDGNVGEDPYTENGLVSWGTLYAVQTQLHGCLPVPASLSGIIPQDGDAVQGDGQGARLVLQLEEEKQATFEPNDKLVIKELQARDLELVIVAARIPKTYLGGIKYR